MRAPGPGARFGAGGRARSTEYPVFARRTHARGLPGLLRGALALTLFGAAFGHPWPAHAGPDNRGALTGHVRRPEGRPVDLVLTRDGHYFASAQVDSDGTFLFSGVPAGPYTLLVRAAWCDRIEMPVRVGVGAVDTVGVDLACSPIPCPKLDKADPGCILHDPDQRAKVGTACEVHPKQRLHLDVVPISYGIGSHAAAWDARFPNARVVYSSGCVVQPQRWSEVAYCQECRAAFYLHNPQYLLHPIQPFD